MYLANQLDGKIFDQPGLMPTKQSYSDFVQTKVRRCARCWRRTNPLQRAASMWLPSFHVYQRGCTRNPGRVGRRATQVSFNGGAHWQDLQQPESFQYPECNACKQASTCQLHLHGPSSWHYGAGVPSPPMLTADSGLPEDLKQRYAAARELTRASGNTFGTADGGSPRR